MSRFGMILECSKKPVLPKPCRPDRSLSAAQGRSGNEAVRPGRLGSPQRAKAAARAAAAEWPLPVRPQWPSASTANAVKDRSPVNLLKRMSIVASGVLITGCSGGLIIPHTPKTTTVQQGSVAQNNAKHLANPGDQRQIPSKEFANLFEKIWPCPQASVCWAGTGIQTSVNSG